MTHDPKQNENLIMVELDDDTMEAVSGGRHKVIGFGYRTTFADSSTEEDTEPVTIPIRPKPPKSPKP